MNEIEPLHVLDNYDHIPTHEIYQERSINLATLIGGVGAGSYLLVANYKILETAQEPTKGNYQRILVLGTLLQWLLITVSIMAEWPTWLSFVVYSLFLFLPSIIFHQSQAKTIHHYLRDKRPISSYKQVFKVGSCFLGITLGIFAGTTGTKFLMEKKQREVLNIDIKKMLDEHYVEYKSLSFGRARHRISFSNREVTEEYVEELGEKMTTWGYFNHQEKTIYLDRSEQTYTLKIIDDNAGSLDMAIKEQYLQLKQDLNAYFSPSIVEIILVKEEDLEEYARF